MAVRMVPYSLKGDEKIVSTSHWMAVGGRVAGKFGRANVLGPITYDVT